MRKVGELKIKVYADGAELSKIIELAKNPLIKGFTTNPTLMKKAGIKDYKAFAQDVLQAVPELPVSFEVFSDEFDEMRDQAKTLASWGDNVFVKIPISNTKGDSSLPLIQDLAKDGVQLNITAIMTLDQVDGVIDSLNTEVASIISVFCGRIADTGIDPMGIMKNAVEYASQLPKAELLWASTREVLNIIQAENSGCQIITVPHAILDKLNWIGRDLDEVTLDTVKMFYNDAQSAGFTIDTGK